MEKIRLRSFDTLFESSVGAWQSNPSVMMPAMLNSALQVAKQAAIILPILILISQLTSKGLLPDNLLLLLDPNEFLALVSSPELLSLLIPTILVALVAFTFVSIAGSGFVISVEYGSYNLLMEKEKLQVDDVLDQFQGRWRSISWTFLLVNSLVYGPAIVIGGAIAILLLVNGPSPTLPSQIFPLLGLLIIGIVAGLFFAVFTIYAYPSVILDRTSGLGAISRSFQMVSRIPGQSITYLVVRIGTVIAIGIIITSTDLIGLTISTLLLVLVNFLIIPILHLTKVGIYRGAVLEADNLIDDGKEWRIIQWGIVIRSVLDKVKLGLREVRNFALGISNIPFHLISAVLIFAGFLWGVDVATNGLLDVILSSGYEVGRINPEFQSIVPPFLGIDISFNNWQVSLATAFAGLGLLPTVIGLVFNGFILGVVSQLTPNYTMFLAAIVPHGVLELPAFVLAGSVGLRLGIGVLKTIPTRRMSNQLRKDIRQSLYVVIGLAPIFLIAGLVEAILTPYIMSLYGWI